MTLTRQVYELNICFLVCLAEVYTWRGREGEREGGRYIGNNELSETQQRKKKKESKK